MEAERVEAEHAETERVERVLPLTPATFAILLTLASGEKHGYAIMREIAASSEGVLRVGPGTLYHAIKQLLAAGMIAETGDRPDPALDDQRRRYYRLTGFGRRVVQAEAVRLAQLVRQAGAQGLLGGSELQPGMQPGGIGGAR
jgi:DNA-binding PadR family transcriptional regulator